MSAPVDLPGATTAGNPLEHAATIAWLSLNPGGRRPTAVTTLKSCRKSSVYRLHDVLPDSSAVVAKRAPRGTMAVERLMHETVLPSLPLPRLDYLGAVDEGAEEGRVWLFMRDAGDRSISADHHVLLAQCLARLHTSAVDSAAVRAGDLPDRGIEHYRRRVDGSRHRLRAMIAELRAANDAAARSALEQNLALLDRLAARWSGFSRVAAVMPATLTHCDLTRRNVRICARHGESTLYLFDWEMAGWGNPAADLGSFGTKFKAGPAAIGAYASAVRRRWPAIDAAATEQARRVGIVMMVIAWMEWEIDCLGYGRDERRIRKLEYYAERLIGALGASEGLGLI